MKIRHARPGEGGSGGKIGESQREHVSISLTITATDHHLPRVSVKRGVGVGVGAAGSGSIFFFLKNAVLVLRLGLGLGLTLAVTLTLTLTLTLTVKQNSLKKRWTATPAPTRTLRFTDTHPLPPTLYLAQPKRIFRTTFYCTTALLSCSLEQANLNSILMIAAYHLLLLLSLICSTKLKTGTCMLSRFSRTVGEVNKERTLLSLS